MENHTMPDCDLDELYLHHFEEARSRSTKLGLEESEFSIRPEKPLPHNYKNMISSLVGQFIVSFLGGDQRRMAGQCFTVCTNLMFDIQDQLGIDTEISIGNLYAPNGRVFGAEPEHVESLVTNPEHRNSMNLHAWLTLENGVIVDPTFSTTFAVFYNHPVEKAGITLGTPNERRGALRYEPVILGIEYFQKTGMFKGMFFPIQNHPPS